MFPVDFLFIGIQECVCENDRNVFFLVFAPVDGVQGQSVKAR